MAKNLGLEVVAEGVETEAQLRFLMGKGCRRFQGYYFSRPRAEEDFEKILRGMGRSSLSRSSADEGGIS
jgi:EAL domain-containing protein (putative c-di-GMP-specific phosphodiesterase class I)